MQRIINDPDMVVEEMLRGFAKAHPDRVKATENPRVLVAAGAPRKGRVGIVTGGGSGHKPAFIGYLGRNMVDAVAVGEIFSSPTAVSFLDAFKAADSGAGVACLYGNYAGDNMNVKMAMQDAADAGMRVKTVVANDDVPSAPASERKKRRGVAGEVLMWKVGGAKAALGGSLDEVVAAAQKAIDNTRSIGLGLTPCTIPAVELGIGHHGEPGVRVTELQPAAKIAEMCCEIVLPDLPFAAGDEVVCLVSGLGATPVMELYIFFAEVERLLHRSGIKIYRPYVGNFFTSLEMSGVTLTLMKVDSELKRLVDLECDSMGLTQFGAGA
jgi:dihydroxyacetone kinase-like protein